MCHILWVSSRAYHTNFLPELAAETNTTEPEVNSSSSQPSTAPTNIAGNGVIFHTAMALTTEN